MDSERRDLEHALAADPGNASAAVRLATMLVRDGAELHGPPRPPLSASVRDELRRRALNCHDAEALAILLRDQRRSWRATRIKVDDKEERVGFVPYRSVIPIPSSIGSVDWKTALVDHETFGDGLTAPRRDFFVNLVQDAQGRPKIPLLPGREPIPRNHIFLLYEILVLADAGCSVRDADKFWNEGVLRLWLQRVPREWPVRLLMPPPRQVPTSEIEFTETIFALRGRMVSVDTQPIRIQWQEQLEVSVECGGIERLGVSVCLLGIMTRASL